MAERSLRWGLLGASRIARKFAADARACGQAVAAVASRDEARARALAETAGVPTYHASYQALLEDPGVEAVYISVPNHLHAEWSARALRAGKHVLCEKPGFLSEAECREVLGAARAARVFYMEGFMYRCHPVWGLVKAIIADGRIGNLKSLESAFCYDMGFKPDNIRQTRAAGGGALLDVGCYCLSFSRMLAGAEPVALSADSLVNPDTGVDEWTRAELRFASGLTATFECALRKAAPHLAVIHGDLGKLEIVSPWHPDRDRAPLRLTVGGAVETYHAGDGLPMFGREVVLVAEHLDDGQCPAMSWDDSLGQARALEILHKQAMAGAK
jgi:predicted dehydrogenase